MQYNSPCCSILSFTILYLLELHKTHHVHKKQSMNTRFDLHSPVDMYMTCICKHSCVQTRNRAMAFLMTSGSGDDGLCWSRSASDRYPHACLDDQRAKKIKQDPGTRNHLTASDLYEHRFWHVCIRLCNDAVPTSLSKPQACTRERLFLCILNPISACVRRGGAGFVPRWETIAIWTCVFWTTTK